jgi:predicted hotdog family 3-hydroxylacyl-ACP dehydratase
MRFEALSALILLNFLLLSYSPQSEGVMIIASNDSRVDIIGRAGCNYQRTCCASDDGEVLIGWLSRGIRVANASDIFITNIREGSRQCSTIHFQPAREGRGDYACLGHCHSTIISRNIHAFISPGSQTIKVEGDKVKNITGRRVGDYVSVGCMVQSCVEDAYSVRFLDPRGSVIYSQFGTQLVLTVTALIRLESDNSGMYSCEVVSSSGEVSDSAVFSFTGRVMPSTPAPPTNGSQTIKVEGDKVKNITGRRVGDYVSVGCMVQSCVEDAYSVRFLDPRGSVIYSQFGTQLMLTVTALIRLESDNSGMYSCEVVSSSGEVLDSAVFSFTGRVMPSTPAPPTNVTVVDKPDGGSSLEWEEVSGLTYLCFVEGKPYVTCTSPFVLSDNELETASTKVRVVSLRDGGPVSFVGEVTVNSCKFAKVPRLKRKYNIPQGLVSFTWSTKGHVQFTRCKVDDGRPRLCQSGVQYNLSNLTSGPHKLQVIAYCKNTRASRRAIGFNSQSGIPKDPRCQHLDIENATAIYRISDSIVSVSFSTNIPSTCACKLHASERTLSPCVSRDVFAGETQLLDKVLANGKTWVSFVCKAEDCGTKRRVVAYMDIQ